MLHFSNISNKIFLVWQKPYPYVIIQQYFNICSSIIYENIVKIQVSILWYLVFKVFRVMNASNVCFAVNLDNFSSALTLAKHSIKKRSSSGNWQKYNISSRVFNVYLHNYCLDLNVSWYIFGGLGCLTEFQPYKPKPELQLKTNCCLICCILPAFLRF